MATLRKLLREQSVDEIQITYKCRTPWYRRPLITTSKDADRTLRPFYRDHMDAWEAVRLILLDGASRCKAVLTLSTGGLDRSIIDPRIVFAAACRTLSSHVILSHNHPCGQLVPSCSDIESTATLRTIGLRLEIPVRDHLILGRTGYFSFADAGLL